MSRLTVILLVFRGSLIGHYLLSKYDFLTVNDGNFFQYIKKINGISDLHYDVISLIFWVSSFFTGFFREMSIKTFSTYTKNYTSKEKYKILNEFGIFRLTLLIILLYQNMTF